MQPDALERWTASHARELYGVREWGHRCFDVSDRGEVEVVLRAAGADTRVSLLDIVRGVRERGLDLPVLLRFRDLLDQSITELNEAFRKAISDLGYRGEYRGVYPIKVNQQSQVLEEITAFGRRFHHGLEAGSKAELIAALAYLDDPEAYLVCNGYKDAEFIDLALAGQKAGLCTVIVLEMPDEVELVLARAAALGVRPCIGVRVKLSSRANGRWTESGGDRSVFGLNMTDTIRVIDLLRDRGMLDCLRMLHYHLGSQIPNIGSIRTAIGEAARIYVDLCREGATMGLIDIGGGLAVDYDGSHTNFASSRNYHLAEYCADIVEGVMAAADESGVPHPTIISESGRALVSYSSVLVFNILDVSRFAPPAPPETLGGEDPDVLRNLFEVAQGLSTKNIQETYHDAVFYRDEIRDAFLHGTISLRQRALGERIFWHTLARIAEDAKHLKYVPEELRELDQVLSDTYYANFSVFQSLPDAWAIDQLFPIMPIHRLDERPTRRGTLSDITCDCDGKIDRFIDLHDVQRTLPLHELREREDYMLGVFLVGAYQETLGDLHNLFGDTNIVSVRLDEGGRIDFTDETAGDSVADVLSYVEYDPKQLVGRFRDQVERAVRDGRITPRDRRELLNAYETGLRGYTYFERS
jgi:arginine decarboxylase